MYSAYYKYGPMFWLNSTIFQIFKTDIKTTYFKTLCNKIFYLPCELTGLLSFKSLSFVHCLMYTTELYLFVTPPLLSTVLVDCCFILMWFWSYWRVPRHYNMSQTLDKASPHRNIAKVASGWLGPGRGGGGQYCRLGRRMVGRLTRAQDQ